ncbi:glycosyltransferase, partial [Candidatus Uhrbacteria bacterium]|nr:glycosyltransferase [Candidatus Uhrbacteria bacterium]
MKLRSILLSYERSFMDATSNASLRLSKLTTDGLSITAILLNNLEKAGKREDGAIRVVGFSGFVLLRLIGGFRALLREIRQAKRRDEGVVISAQDPFITGAVAFLASRITNTPYEVQEHGDFYSGYWVKEVPIFKRIFAWIGCFVLRRADAVRVVSERIRGHLVTCCNVDAQKMTINPVRQDLDWHLRQASRSWSGTPTIVVPCRYVHQKGIDVLLKALAILKKEGELFTLRLIGSGPLDLKIRIWIRENGLSDEVTLEQWASQESIWNKADLFVLSSRYEGFGRTITEAMAARVPIVTTNVGCVGSLLRPQIDGRVVEPDDVQGLAAAIREQFTEPDRRGWMVRNAYE